MKHTFTLLCVHLWLMLTQYHHQQSLQTFSLSSKPTFHREISGNGNTKGLAQGDEMSMKATSCSQHRASQKWPPTLFKAALKKKKQANLFIYSHLASWIFNNCSVIHPGFHHFSQGTKMEITGFILQKFWELGLSLIGGANHFQTM